MNNGTRDELNYELQYGIIYNLIQTQFGRSKAKALTDYVFETLNYKSMTFSTILQLLDDVDVCEVCEEAYPIDFLESSEGMVGGGLGDDGCGYVCEYCVTELD